MHVVSVALAKRVVWNVNLDSFQHGWASPHVTHVPREHTPKGKNIAFTAFPLCFVFWNQTDSFLILAVLGHLSAHDAPSPRIMTKRADLNAPCALGIVKCLSLEALVSLIALANLVCP